MTVFGSTNSFGGHIYREEFRLLIPRSNTDQSVSIQGIYGVVNRNPTNSRRPIPWPEDPNAAGQPLTPIDLVPMGPGDGLMLIAGGESDSAFDSMNFIITKIDPVANGDGEVIAFVERITAAANARRTVGTGPFRFANEAADELEDIEVGDNNVGVWTTLIGAPTFMSDATAPAAMFVDGDQSSFLRVYAAVGGWESRWCYGLRTQGGAVPVWR